MTGVQTCALPIWRGKPGRLVSSIYLAGICLDYREGSVTVVSHFQGGRTPDLVTGVVAENAPDCYSRRKRRDETPRGISPLLSELAKIRLRLPDHNFVLRSCSGTAGFSPLTRTPREPMLREPAGRRLKRPVSRRVHEGRCRSS